MCVYFCFRGCFFAFFEGLRVEEFLRVDALRVDALRVDALRVEEVLRCFVEGQNFSRASFSL